MLIQTKRYCALDGESTPLEKSALGKKYQQLKNIDLNELSKTEKHYIGFQNILEKVLRSVQF